MDNNGQQLTTMDNNVQQWTTIRGATCISDAVFHWAIFLFSTSFEQTVILFWSKVKSADEVICIFISKSLSISHHFWSNCISEYYEPIDNQKRAINLIIYFSHRNQIFYNRNLEIIPLQENVNRPKKRIVQLPILWMFISLHLSDFLQNIHRPHPVVFFS